MESREIHAALQNLLLEHGCYDPIELLIRSGVLSYSCYRDWRTGERPVLDSSLEGGPAAAERVLQIAADWASALGLQGHLADHAGWGDQSGVMLTASAVPRLDVLLCTSYRPSEEADQLDLFSHSAINVALSGLADALMSRNPAHASDAIDRVAALSPEHGDIGRARSLIAALEASPSSDPAEARRMLERLPQAWLPAAEAIFGARSRDFLAPLWQSLAQALEREPFDPREPNGHASWLFAQCLDWGGVRRCILTSADKLSHPLLIARLAEAERRLGDRIAAVESWFDLCWIAPEVFRQCVQATDFPTGPSHSSGFAPWPKTSIPR